MKNLFKTNVMKTRSTSTGSKKWITAGIMAFGLIGVYNAVQAQSQSKEVVVVSAPTTLDADNAASKVNAKFPGGINEFYGFVASKLTPDSTCCPGKRVYVMFMIDKEGKLKRAKVQGHVLSDKMNDQLVKIFESAPQWTPAMQNGREVKEHFICPVTFMPKADMMAKATIPGKK